MVEYIWEEEFCGIPSDVVTDVQRDILYLRYVSLMDIEEISYETGITVESVAENYSMALRCVAEFLSNRVLLMRCQSLYKP
jgi:hypothetical protein